MLPSIGYPIPQNFHPIVRPPSRSPQPPSLYVRSDMEASVKGTTECEIEDVETMFVEIKG